MKILFMSEEHSIKRKIASCIAHHLAEGEHEVYQSKIVFDPTDHILKDVLAEVDITSSVNDVAISEDTALEDYDIIITLCKVYNRKKCSFAGFPIILHWPMKNPVKRGASPHKIQQSLRELRDDLIGRIQHLFADGYTDGIGSLQSRLLDLFDDSSQGNIYFNRDEIITSMNKQAYSLTGYEEGDILGKPLHFLFPDDTVSRHALSVTDDGVGFRLTDLKMKREDKEIMHVRAIFKSLIRDAGSGGYISFVENRDEPIIQPMEGTRGLDRLSWDRVEAALKQTGGNRTKAARVLGVGRATFYRFLEREKLQGRTPQTELC